MSAEIMCRSGVMNCHLLGTGLKTKSAQKSKSNTKKGEREDEQNVIYLFLGKPAILRFLCH